MVAHKKGRIKGKMLPITLNYIQQKDVFGQIMLDNKG
jgi:hypothetical protein